MPRLGLWRHISRMELAVASMCYNSVEQYSQYTNCFQFIKIVAQLYAVVNKSIEYFNRNKSEYYICRYYCSTTPSVNFAQLHWLIPEGIAYIWQLGSRKHFTLKITLYSKLSCCYINNNIHY